MIKTISTALVLALAAPVALVAAPVAEQAQSVSAEAKEFSLLYMPADVAMESALAGFDAEIGKSLSSDPEFQKMEATYPGIAAVVANAARGVLINTIETKLPGVQERLAVFADSKFTGPELRAINAFMNSPEGRSSMAVIASGANSDAYSDKLRATGKLEMSASDLLGMMDPGALAKLSDAERAALVKFSLSPAGRKLDSQTGALASFVASEMTTLMQAMQLPIQEAVSTAIIAHIAAAERK